ncbi:MAG: GTP-binding protein TypA/BipA, partial [uncultured Solirubrobacteraceae bacterium]
PHGPPGQGPPGPRARGQRLPARERHGAPGHLGGPGPRRAAARGARGDDAPGGLRAHGRQAAGGHPGGGREGPRARGAHDDRRPRRLRRRRHPAPGPAQGPDGADDQPRHGLGADGLPRARPRPHRLPHGVPHGDPRHGPHAPRLRPLRALGRRAAHPPDRRPRGRPAGRGDRELLLPAPGARRALRLPHRPGLRGDDRRRERARRRPRRQRGAREAPDEHPLLHGRRARAPHPGAAHVARPGDGVPARGRVRRGHPAPRAPAQGGAGGHGAGEARAQGEGRGAGPPL